MGIAVLYICGIHGHILKHENQVQHFGIATVTLNEAANNILGFDDVSWSGRSGRLGVAVIFGRHTLLCPIG